MSEAAALTDRAAHMEALIHKYFEGCNEADVEKMVSCFVPDAVHYFPPGMYDGPWRGARLIAGKWVAAVENIGSRWTVDRIVCDARRFEAVIEWSHFKTKPGKLLRGDEWYVFDEASGLIGEIRAYYASPQDAEMERLELGGFDYAGRGYPIVSPALPRRP